MDVPKDMAGSIEWVFLESVSITIRLVAADENARNAGRVGDKTRGELVWKLCTHFFCVYCMKRI